MMTNNHTSDGKFKKGNKAAARKKRETKKSLVQYLKENTAGGEELFDELLKLVRGRKTSNKDKLAAIKLLMERGWGKAAQPVDANVQGNIVFKWEGENDSDSDNTVQTTPVSSDDTPES